MREPTDIERVRPQPATKTIEDRIVEIVGATVDAAIARAEERGEERARARRTHLSVAEAAESLGISRRHCQALVADGTIPSVRLGERVVIPVHRLERLGEG